MARNALLNPDSLNMRKTKVETAEKVTESLRIHVRMREVRILQAKIPQITRMVVVRISQIKITAEEKFQ